jgi:hypothetical protein
MKARRLARAGGCFILRFKLTIIRGHEVLLLLSSIVDLSLHSSDYGDPIALIKR